MGTTQEWAEWRQEIAARRLLPATLCYFRRDVGRLISVCVCVVLIWCAFFTGQALASRGHVFEGQTFGSLGSGNGQFEGPDGVALNEATGRIYVVDSGNNRVEYFNAEGAYEGQFNGEGAPEKLSDPNAIAVDNTCHLRKLSGSACTNADPSNEDVYVVDREHKVVDRFTPTGTFYGQLTETPGKVANSEEQSRFGEIEGVAVDASGKVWVHQDQKPENYVASFGANGIFLSSFGTFGRSAEPGMAVDTTGDLYLNELQEKIYEYDEGGEPLREGQPLDEEDSSGVAVEQTSGDVYVDNVTSVARFSSTGKPLERFGAGQLRGGSGMAVNPQSGVVYVADATDDKVDTFSLEPTAHPVMSNIGVTKVGVGEAVIAAEVNPRSEPGEPETEFGIEYGPCLALVACGSSPYGARIVAERLLPDFELHQVTAEVTGLYSHASYHARIFAKNKHGEERSEELTFTTQAFGPEFTLPDDRAWEMVSPPNKHDARIFGVGRGPLEAAEDGSAITYLAFAPIEEEAQGNRIEYAQSLSRRGAVGWSTQEIVAPNSRFTGYPVGFDGEYKLFSSDLSLGFMYPTEVGTSQLSMEASGWTPYLRHDFLSSTEICPKEPSACWTPLVSSKEPYADVPPTTELKADEFTLQGATADLAHAIVGHALEGNKDTIGTLYEWSAAEPWQKRLSVVGLLPKLEGGVTVDCETGGDAGLGDKTNYGMGNAISKDGSRIVFEVNPDSECGAMVLQHHIYLRNLKADKSGETLKLDLVQPGSEETQRAAEEPDPAFQAASADGSRILFTDRQRLTENAGTYAAGGELDGDLYQCEIKTFTSTGTSECKLTDLTPKNKAGEAAQVVGSADVSQDGEYVYFVAKGVLPEANENEAQQVAEAGMPNLYMAHDDSITFIATLAPNDSADWSARVGKISRVSPDGHWLEFMSDRSLTGYDNRDVFSGQPDEEVYLYDGQTGMLACASCDPSGARPEGEVAETIQRVTLVNSEHNGPWEGRWVAATVPSLDNVNGSSAVYQSRYLSDGGRLFFDARDSLSPWSTNRTWDVYEYEPPRNSEASLSDSCTTSASTYSERNDGCINLISSGSDEHESAFLDASENGNDVFFLTAAKLVGKDYDSAYDIYDAHACSSESPCIEEATTPPECTTTESCREAPESQPQLFGPPSTATLIGSGNLKLETTKTKPKSKETIRRQKLKRALRLCHKKKSKTKRLACERRARKKYGLKAQASSRNHKSKKSK